MSTLTIQSDVLNIVAHPAADWPSLAPLWSRLAKSSHCSIFVSPEWIENWLNVFGSQVHVSILVAENEGEPMGACVLVSAKVGFGSLSMRRLSLNASGEPLNDTTYVEFNNLLALPGQEERVAQALISYLRKEKWDELALLGFLPGAAYESIKAAFGDLACEEVVHPSHYVDLALIRASGLSYEATLKGSTAKHLRQNVRYYSKQGPIKIEEARDAAAALGMLAELEQLSKKRWTEKHGRSIFSSARFVQFHRDFISKCLDRGMVQMLRVTAGDHVIGVLYNLVYRGKVYFYQCGFDYSLDSRLCPGRVALLQAIQYSMNAGHDDFDFLSGESQYKKSLALSSRKLAWLTLRKTGLRPKLAKTLSRLTATARGTLTA